jgi:hypothetical protein
VFWRACQLSRIEVTTHDKAASRERHVGRASDDQPGPAAFVGRMVGAWRLLAGDASRLIMLFGQLESLLVWEQWGPGLCDRVNAARAQIFWVEWLSVMLIGTHEW